MRDSMARKIYHVLAEDGEWTVRRAGGQRATSRHPTKRAAIAKATELARGPEPVHVIIHRQDGTVEEAHSYE